MTAFMPKYNSTWYKHMKLHDENNKKWTQDMAKHDCYNGYIINNNRVIGLGNVLSLSCKQDITWNTSDKTLFDTFSTGRGTVWTRQAWRQNV